MRLLFRERTETLDMGQSGWREDSEISFFIFEFIALPSPPLGLLSSADAKGLRALLEGYLQKALAASETLFFLLWAEIENRLIYEGIEGFPLSEDITGSLSAFAGIFAGRENEYGIEENIEHTRRALFNLFDLFGMVSRSLEMACLFCLDRDMALHGEKGLTAAHKWYIYERMKGAENPMRVMGQAAHISEATVIDASDIPMEDEGDDALVSEDEYLAFFGEPQNAAIYKALANRTDIETVRSFSFDSFFGLICAEFWNMIINNVALKTCSYCGKYFIPFSGNSEYCGRMIPGKNKTCREYAPMYFHRRKGGSDAMAKIYKRADSAHYMRHKRHPSHYTWDQFTTWRERASALLARAQAGEMTEEEFKAKIKPNNITL